MALILLGTITFKQSGEKSGRDMERPCHWNYIADSRLVDHGAILWSNILCCHRFYHTYLTVKKGRGSQFHSSSFNHRQELFVLTHSRKCQAPLVLVSIIIIQASLIHNISDEIIKEYALLRSLAQCQSADKHLHVQFHAYLFSCYSFIHLTFLIFLSRVRWQRWALAPYNIFI